MDFIIQNWTIVLAAIMSGGYILLVETRKGASGITPSQAVQLINRDKGVVVDVRPPIQFESGHVVNSRNIPLEKLKTDGVAGLPTNKTLPIILVCLTGYGSKKAKIMLKAAGYDNVHILSGGIREWAKAEFPLEKGEALIAKKQK